MWHVRIQSFRGRSSEPASAGCRGQRRPAPAKGRGPCGSAAAQFSGRLPPTQQLYGTCSAPDLPE
eukprot:7388380-Prymnesium_polylepis.1